MKLPEDHIETYILQTKNNFADVTKEQFVRLAKISETKKICRNAKTTCLQNLFMPQNETCAYAQNSARVGLQHSLNEMS